MEEIGYESIQMKGFLSAWMHQGEVKYNLVVEASKNEFKLLKEQDLFANSYTVSSWRRLMEVLYLYNNPKDYEDEEHDYVDDDYVDCDDCDDDEE